MRCARFPIATRKRAGRRRPRGRRPVTCTPGVLAIAGPSGSARPRCSISSASCHAADTGTIRPGRQGTSRCSASASGPACGGNGSRSSSRSLNLIPVLTAYENVEYVLLTRPLPFASGAAEPWRPWLRSASPTKPAGAPAHVRGQQQRVAVARALVRDVGVILADEPTAALDQTTGRAVMDLLKRLNRDRGITFVFSTHDPGSSRRRIASCTSRTGGSPHETRGAPAHVVAAERLRNRGARFRPGHHSPWGPSVSSSSWASTVDS